MSNNYISVSEPVVMDLETEKAGTSRKKSFSDVFSWVKNKSMSSSNTSYTEFGSITDVAPSRSLGTFSGVFCPVALSMFSALLFLRVGFVVGNAGLLGALLQFGIAYAIIYCTVSSVCAISTNGEVEGGGVYFMISRTLGPEFGGSIGTLFFFANIVSSALYDVGFAEGVINNFSKGGYISGNEEILPSGGWWPFIYASTLNLINLLICLLGANMFAKTSVFVWTLVTAGILSSFYSFIVHSPMQIPIHGSTNILTNNTIFANYTTPNVHTLEENLRADYGTDYTSGDIPVTFSLVFGVLFSGVTGIMAGANMSGELKNPGKNIPRGTLSAVSFTMVFYMILAVLAASSCSRDLLQRNYLFLMPINVWPMFITIGILTATFFASLSNLIGSSRVLEALARDNIYGSILDVVTSGVWKSNPIVAVFLSWLAVQLMLLIGSLNTIAQINSILFLLAYLAINLACLGLELASAPNFRPSFKYFTWYTAFMGLAGSAIMMVILNPLYATTSIGLCLLMVLLLNLFSPARYAEWGSISQALIFHQVRKYLLLLDSRKDHVKFWRPQMLLLVNNPNTCCPLISFVNDLKKSGLYVLGHVMVRQTDVYDVEVECCDNSDWLTFVDFMKIKAFVEITVARSVREGLHHLIRLSGMGAMKPNTIIFGFYGDSGSTNSFSTSCSVECTEILRSRFPIKENDEKMSLNDYVSMVTDVLKMKKNVCVCRHFHKLDKTLLTKSNCVKYIDVWPINFFHPFNRNVLDTTELFMLQLSCILNMVRDWKNLKVRVFLCDSNENATFNEEVSSMEYAFKTALNSLRIRATVVKAKNWSEHFEYFQSCLSSSDDVTSYKSYLQRVNQILKNECNETAAVFLYLPVPPSLRYRNYTSDDVSRNYLDNLTTLTNNLPPTILVHGINTVTSTRL